MNCSNESDLTQNLQTVEDLLNLSRTSLLTPTEFELGMKMLETIRERLDVLKWETGELDKGVSPSRQILLKRLQDITIREGDPPTVTFPAVS
jgi:hypothetical protein